MSQLGRTHDCNVYEIHSKTSGQFQIAMNDEIDIWMVIISIGTELQKLGFNVNIVLDRDTGGGCC